MVLLGLVPSCSPETGEAIGTDDLKQRLSTATYAYALYPLFQSVVLGKADAYHLRQSRFSALFSVCVRISAGVLQYWTRASSQQ